MRWHWYCVFRVLVFLFTLFFPVPSFICRACLLKENMEGKRKKTEENLASGHERDIEQSPIAEYLQEFIQGNTDVTPANPAPGEPYEERWS